MARILLIDDDEAILDLEKVILMNGGHDVLVCHNALDGLDLLEVHEMDLVIADIQMPRLNGLDFVHTIRKNPRLQSLPVAFITSSNKNNDVANAKKLGASFYLLKPIDKTQFLARVNSFFESHPPEPHPRVLFSEIYSVHVVFQQSVQISAMSDLGIEVSLRQELTPGQLIEIPSAVFSDFTDQNVIAKVAWTKPSKGGEWKAFFEFADHSQPIIRRIQRFIEYKNRPEVLIKYPKTR